MKIIQKGKRSVDIDQKICLPGSYVLLSFVIEGLDTSAALMNAVVGTAIVTLMVGEISHLKIIQSSQFEKRFYFL